MDSYRLLDCRRRRCTDVMKTSSCTFIWSFIDINMLKTTRSDRLNTAKSLHTREKDAISGHKRD